MFTMGERQRPSREPALREAIIVSSGYARQNIIEDVWAEDLRDFATHYLSNHHQDHASIEKATAEFRPAAEEARAAVRGQTVLVDGFLAPCWF